MRSAELQLCAEQILIRAEIQLFAEAILVRAELELCAPALFRIYWIQGLASLFFSDVPQQPGFGRTLFFSRDRL